ncbi:Uncharacterised protein [Mycobacterium tuberculosis]|nr:Uncharacterised protein [Mycobacterium tuberculosis]
MSIRNGGNILKIILVPSIIELSYQMDMVANSKGQGWSDLIISGFPIQEMLSIVIDF